MPSVPRPQFNPSALNSPMLLLAFRKTPYKRFIVWLFAYFLMFKSHFLCKTILSYSMLSPACQAIHHSNSSYIGYSFFREYPCPHLESTRQISTHPSRLSSRDTSSGKPSLIFHLCDSSTLGLSPGAHTKLGLLTAETSSTDYVLLLRAGTGSLASETPCAKFRIKSLLYYI